MLQNKNLSSIITNKLFKGVGEELVRKYFRQGNFLEIKEGDIVYQNGDDNSIIYLISDGDVKLKIPSDFGTSIILLKTRDDFFGEKEFIEKTARKTSAVANSNCMLYKLNKKEIAELVSKNISIRRNLLGKDDEVSSEDEKGKNAVADDSQNNHADIRADDEPVLNDAESMISETKEDLTEPYPEELAANDTEEAEQVLNDSPDNNMEFTIVEDAPDENGDNSTINEQPDSAEKIIRETASLFENPDDEINENIIENNTLEDPPIKTDNYLNEINRQLVKDLVYLYRSRTFADAATTIVELIKMYTSSQYGKIFIVDSESKILNLIETNNGKAADHKLDLTGGLVGYAVSNNETINLKTPELDERLIPEIDLIEDAKVETLLYVPMLNNIGEVSGLLCVFNTSNEKYGGKDIAYLRAISEHALNIIGNFVQADEIKPGQRRLPLDRFSNFVIDDIKTSLLITRHYSEFIKKKDTSDEIKLISEYMTKQLDSVLRLSSVISDFINNSKNLNADITTVNELLNDTLGMLAEYVEAHKVKLFKKYDCDASVSADKIQFYYAVYQLIKVACFNLHQDGAIYLTTCSGENNEANIIMKYAGGIINNNAPELKTENLFEGILELSLAKKIIGDHNGSLEITTNENKETEFLIKLPIVLKDTDI